MKLHVQDLAVKDKNPASVHTGHFSCIQLSTPFSDHFLHCQQKATGPLEEGSVVQDNLCNSWVNSSLYLIFLSHQF